MSITKQKKLTPIVEALSIKQLQKQAKDFQEKKIEMMKFMPDGIVHLKIKNKKTGEYDDKPYLTRAMWRWLALAFNVSAEVVHQERERNNGVVSYHFTVRASVPNGRCIDAVGACSSAEYSFKRKEHDIEATAQTRATSRAIADLIGGGEITYEEMSARQREGNGEIKPEAE